MTLCSMVAYASTLKEASLCSFNFASVHLLKMSRPPFYQQLLYYHCLFRQQLIMPVVNTIQTSSLDIHAKCYSQ